MIAVRDPHGFRPLCYGRTPDGAYVIASESCALSAVGADIVIGVPDSGLEAALGFSGASRIPYGIGLVKNKYIGRTFISPGQDERFDQLRIKLNPVNHVIAGKCVVLIDDSIVRGTTSRRIVMLLREAGAKEIHMRISAPPFLHLRFYTSVFTPLFLWYRY